VWYAKDVLHMANEYVRVQNLQPYFRLNSNVLESHWDQAQERWLLKARQSHGL
jgi:cation diffusion facilitator CzcD-associated flavoprotein CzcO